MATAAKVMLASLDKKVEGLKAAVNKLDEAAKQVSADQDQNQDPKPAIQLGPEAGAPAHP